MKITEILVAAKALIDTPEKHTTGTAARDSIGLPIPTLKKGAVCFCILGAIYRVTSGEEDFVKSKCIFKEANYIEGVAKFNDTVTHQEVMVAFDKAIAHAQQKGI